MNVIKNRFSYVLMLISVFLFIYAPRLILSIPVNLSVILLLIFIIFYNKYLAKAILVQPFFLFFWLFLSFYNYVIAILYGHDYTYFSKISASVSSYLIFGSIIYYVSSDYNFFKEKSSFIFILKILLYTILVNSIIILLEFIFPEFKSLIESILFNDFNNLDIIHYADHPFILRGFSSAAGAGQSLYCSLGVLILIYFYYIGEFNVMKTFIFFTILFLSQIFLGRIGLIFTLIYFIILLIKIALDFLYKSTAFRISTFFQLLFIIGIGIYFFHYIDLDADVLKWSFDWIDSNNGIVENASSKEITENYFFLPSNIIHLLFGVGYFEGLSALYKRSDVGYVKTIFSCGILLSFLLYFLTFLKLFKLSNKIHGSSFFFYLLILTLLFAEFKEPFIYQNFAGRALFLILGYLASATSKKSLILYDKVYS